ncbi:MAG: hypothetical protein KJO07_16755, partial [Deltaproteobacteria bacterium]|nr:hypothetical protein [Deltaproteobacteria bacterium]
CDPDTELGFPISNIDPCLLPASGGDQTLSSDSPLSTDSFMAGNAVVLPQVHGGAQEVLVLRYDNLTIGDLLVIGSRPIVFVANSITVTGDLQVRSNSRSGASPGADTDCGGGLGQAGAITPNSNGYQGGSGGGYAADGGKGAPAEGGSTVDPGTTNGNDTIEPLRGGCRGGQGGRPSNPLLNLAQFLAQVGPGSGGGGVQLIASANITVQAGGTIAAPGRGGGTFYVNGLGGLARSGGSGGGSGGAILLEAPNINIDGRLVALGGGGGEGRDNGTNNGSQSSPGDSAAPLDGDNKPAEGGSTSNQDGGDGGTGSDDKDNSKGGDGDSGSDIGDGDRSGGGGGGGGVGRIRLRVVGGALNVNGTVQPPAREDVE